MKRAAFLILLLVWLAPGVHAEIDLDAIKPQSLEHCDGLRHAHPKELMAYACYWVVAQNRNHWADAAHRLEAFLATDPRDHAARFYLGNVVWGLGDQKRAETLYAEAIQGFTEAGNLAGEGLAAVSQAMLFRGQGRLAESRSALDRAERVAQASGSKNLQVMVIGQRAQQAFDQEHDYGKAWSLFKQLEAAVFPDGPSQLQSWALSGLGAVCRSTGRDREALDYYIRQAEMEHRNGRSSEEASTRYNVALLSAEVGGAPPEQTDQRYREALDAAVRSGNRLAEASVRASWAGLSVERHRNRTFQGPAVSTHSGDRAVGEAAARESGAALAAARELRSYQRTFDALVSLARAESLLGPEKHGAALQHAEETLRMAQERQDLPRVATALRVQAETRWDFGDREAAIEDAFAALDVIEKIRNLQPEELIRAGSFARYTPAYYRTAGMVLGARDGEPGPEALNLAFTLSERVRARLFLDELDAAQATRMMTERHPLSGARREVLKRIAEVQKRLAPGDLGTDERETVLADLERLEGEEAALRDRMARSDWVFRALRQPAIPSLTQVQQALGPEQALLSFLISPRVYRGGSWVFVITRDLARVLAVPSRDELSTSVAIYLGLLERRDPLEGRAGARLYRDLLGQALEGLPPEVDRLVVVPDAAVASLPLDALRAKPGAPPLVSRYQITLVPSATTWLRLEQARPGSPELSVLSIADPPLAEPSLAGGPRLRAAPGALRLARLAHTGDEARSLVRRLGGKGDARTGSEASEDMLKRTDLARYAVLHFATHALIDGQHPDRTAVFLAPGSQDEDGLLQVREIVDLHLDGQLVVLSACSSAAGANMPGEGVLGLARAFFLAGAHAVVGSLWPLRDDEAAVLVGEFARHLGRGASVGAALAEAKRSRMRAGDPTAAWAGLVVLGDGDRKPFSPEARRRAWLWVVPAAALLVALLSLRWLAGRRRSEPSGG